MFTRIKTYIINIYKDKNNLLKTGQYSINYKSFISSKYIFFYLNAPVYQAPSPSPMHTWGNLSSCVL